MSRKREPNQATSIRIGKAQLDDGFEFVRGKWSCCVVELVFDDLTQMGAGQWCANFELERGVIEVQTV